jgi:signal recognition particle receptor subunit beta
MALFNYATRELSAKIVYYGPGLSGKTTNIEMVHKMLRPEQKGRLISLPTETDRTLFFDFLPIELGQIKGFKVRFHLYTVPGQVFYNATRRLVLQGVDGVVFVADSQREMTNGNLESMKNLMDNLSSYGKKVEDLPFVIQYNKRDLKNAAPVAELDGALNFLHVPTFEAVAPAGKGVTETLVGISRMVFTHLRKTLLMPGEMVAHDDIGDLADARIRKTFTAQAMEPLEEISDVEEIREGGEASAGVPEAPQQAVVEAPPPAMLEAPLQAAVEALPPAALEAPRAVVEAPSQTAVGEVDLEPASLRAPEAPPAVEFDELSEIEVEIQEKGPEPPAPSVAVSVDVEGTGLAFLKFEAPFVSPEGHAILPALFLDGAGNPVRLRIRVTMEGE